MRRGYPRPGPRGFDPGTSGYASAPRLSSMLSRHKRLLLSISVVEDMWESYCPPDIERV
jgi:hypothetical protein